MAEQRIRFSRKTYAPAAVGSGETVTLFPTKKGRRILWGEMEYIISAAGGATGTIAVQANAAAGGAANGLLAATTDVGTVGAIVGFGGTDLANSGGLLCTGDGLIQAVYTPGVTPGATNPKVRILIAYVEHETHG